MNLYSPTSIDTVEENNISATKMRNIFGAIEIMDFSLLLVEKLSLLIFIAPSQREQYRKEDMIMNKCTKPINNKKRD